MNQPYSILNLAPELVEEIVQSVDDPVDVLNLGLTCKALYKIVVPDHPKLRHVHIDAFDDKGTRDVLATRPLLAGNVRHLHLHMLPTYTTVPEVTRSTQQDHNNQIPLEFLPNIIRTMNRMTRFCFIGHIWPRFRDWADEMFIATSHGMQAIQELDLELWHYADWELPRVKASPPLRLPVDILGQLTALALVVHCNCPQCISHPFYNALVKRQDLLLRDVYLDLTQVRPDYGSAFKPMLKLTVWPRLERFTFNGRDLFSDDEEFENFLQRHPGIMSLALPSADSPNVDIREDLVPALRYLLLPMAYKYTLSESLCRRLWHLGNTMRSGMYKENVPYTDTFRFAHICFGSTEELDELVQRLPMVQRLDCSFVRLNMKDYEGCFSPTIGETETFINILSKLRHLTHLGQFFLYGETLDASKKVGEGLLEMAVNKIPTLTHVMVSKGSKRRWVKLKRNPEGSYEGSEIDRSEDLQDGFWGHFFEGYSELRPTLGRI